MGVLTHFVKTRISFWGATIRYIFKVPYENILVDIISKKLNFLKLTISCWILKRLHSRPPSHSVSRWPCYSSEPFLIYAVRLHECGSKLILWKAKPVFECMVASLYKGHAVESIRHFWKEESISCNSDAPSVVKTYSNKINSILVTWIYRVSIKSLYNLKKLLKNEMMRYRNEVCFMLINIS